MSEPTTEVVREIERLSGFLAYWAPFIRHYDAYYEGLQPIRFMAPAMQREFGERITAMVVNWPRMGADAYENRLDITGFRFSKDASRDEDLQAVWQANNCDEQAQQAHLDSIALSRTYVAVGSGDAPDDPPLISVEHPLQAYVHRDPRTRRGKSGIKRWTEVDGTQWAVLYLPDSTGVYRWDGGWKLDQPVDVHNLGRLPLVPLVNRPRILRPDGVSEFHDVIPLADAANKMATDMMISGEYHAMPRRWAFGLKEEDFVDSAGNQISPWSMMAGHLWANEDPDIKVGQFPEAQLTNFHDTIKLLAQLASQTLALPPHYMSFARDNQTSADAIRSSEAQLVKRVERKQVFLGGAWEEVMRLVMRFQTGTWDPRGESLETIWSDPATPTVAERADAVVKLVQSGILPIEQAREDLGYTPEQRNRMAAMDEKKGLDATLQRILQPPAQQPGTPPVTPAVTANVGAGRNSGA